nr:uncharacterized protein LOC123289159 [Equus asinus]
MRLGCRVQGGKDDSPDAAFIHTLKPASRFGPPDRRVRPNLLAAARRPRAARGCRALLTSRGGASPVRPTGPTGSRARGAFRQRPETRSLGSAAFRLRGRASRRARGAGVDECVLVRVCMCVRASACVPACVSVYARARGVGVRGSQGPLGAHPTLCLRLRLAVALPLAQDPGFGLSCLFNERKEQKAGGRGRRGAGEAGRAPGRACSERDTKRSLRSAGRGRRASRGVRRARLRSPERQGARRGSRKAAGKPNGKEDKTSQAGNSR